MRKEYEKKLRAIVRRRTHSPYQVVQKMEDVLKLQSQYTEGQMMEFQKIRYPNRKRPGSLYKDKGFEEWRSNITKK